jgi:hypothetical protein
MQNNNTNNDKKRKHTDISNDTNIQKTQKINESDSDTVIDSDIEIDKETQLQRDFLDNYFNGNIDKAIEILNNPAFDPNVVKDRKYYGQDIFTLFSFLLKEKEFKLLKLLINHPNFNPLEGDDTNFTAFDHLVNIFKRSNSSSLKMFIQKIVVRLEEKCSKHPELNLDAI